ncbi:MAG: ParB/RepB/Spo0J family partition protein [Oscillospiraceae bacterium]|nr:ParB/RepB/Spo0J family partition protein [Oscillospiraceae bacterium]
MAATRKTAVEKVMSISLAELFPNPNHPVKMREDDSFRETVQSIKERGVIVPAIVRNREGGGYEIIDGRRRKAASELAELPTMPCIIRELDDDAATITMVDSCIQREEILPSERAAAYKMKLAAIKRQGARTDLTSRQDVGKSEAADVLGAETGESGRQIQRYIRLTELSPELQSMVDEKKIAMTPAVEISYLKPEEQQMLVSTIDCEQATPSLSQAQRMKKQSQEGQLTEDSMLAIMCEQKKPEWDKVTLGGEKLRKYFPKSYTPQQIEKTIYRLLEHWHKKQQEQAAQPPQTEN